jgi:hypothetical protein
VIFTVSLKKTAGRIVKSMPISNVLPSEIEGLICRLIEAKNYQNFVLVSDISENMELIGNAG